MNGAASVLAINLSVVLTRIVGITPMFLLALALYLVAFGLLCGVLLRGPRGAGGTGRDRRRAWLGGRLQARPVTPPCRAG